MFRRNLFSSSKHRRAPTVEADATSTIGSSITRSRSQESKATFVEDSKHNLVAHRANSDASFHSQNVPDIVISSIPAASPSKTKADRADDPLGLTLFYAPDGIPSADIIFIHGLGGSSRLTWSKNHDLNLLWPSLWLPSDDDLQNCRIFTFGYNADYRSSSQSPTLGISDFAKNLLFDMLYGRDKQGQSFHLGKAYLEAQLDNRYTSIAESMKAVLFLATPHRGADLSASLNKLLSISFRGSKQYVTELGKHGSFIPTLNEQFRHIAERLQIFSFYETVQTSLGLSSAIIVDEDTAKLGYPGEISRSLNADHHGVCKFESVNDVNYRAVLGVLKSTVSSFTKISEHSAADDMEKIRVHLSISDNVDHDLSLFMSRRVDGTCSSILDETQGATVQHFFFRAGDETKRSVGSLLRFLVFQIANFHPPFRQAVAKLLDGGYKPKDSDWKSTWRKLFVGLLFKYEFEKPLYWVVDGLDESASPQQILELMAEVKSSLTPIRVLATSRWTPRLFTSFGRISSKIPTSWFSLDQDSTDMRIYIEEELQYLSWDDSVKGEITGKVLDQANDNFLWVRLILEEIRDCHTEDDLRQALNELPPGMESLYQRMEETISNIRRPSDRNLSRQLLMWAIYARRPVSLSELSEILEPEFGHILDLTTTITRLCGHFLVLEGENRIGLLHQTAREYLIASNSLPFSLNAAVCHDELFRRSMVALADKALRSKVQLSGSNSLHYRATEWMHHLKATGLPSDFDGQLDVLLKFFKQPFVLTWIQLLASSGQLGILIDTAHSLDTFVKKTRRSDAAREPAQRRFEDLELLDLWSRDLLKLPGKYGAILSQHPASIHSSVAPFCPSNSAIHRTFGSLSSSPRIKGLSEDWDDCLARVSVGSDCQASLISCSAKHLAVVDGNGNVSLWDCTTFHCTRLVTVGESISTICFSENGDRIATYGYRATKVWSTFSGKLLNSFDNPLDMKAITLNFIDDGSALLVGTDRRCLVRGSLQKEKCVWNIIESVMLNDTESLEGTILGSPTALEVSPDHTKVAVAYRRFPLTIWATSPSKIVQRVNRDTRASISPSPFVTSLAWHPNSEEVIGIFMDGYMFKVNIIDGTYHEQPPDSGQFPLHIRVNPDGTIFGICGVHGTIKLYDYQSSTLVYQLTSDDNVADFCFSQDGRRFYDIRGSCCNIWEPNALIRLGATDDHPTSSQAPDESVEQSNLASESFADNPTPIIITSPMPRHSVVCLGDEEGLVALHDYESGQRLKIDRIATGMGIEHLVWSDDGVHFAYAEVGGRLTIVKIEFTTTGWKHERIARFKPKLSTGGMKQLILSSDSEYILVSFKDSTQLWSIQSLSQVEQGRDRTPRNSAQWIVHPSSSAHLLSVTPDDCLTHEWVDLSISSKWLIPQTDRQSNSNSRPLLEREDTDGNTLNSDHVHEAVEKIVPTFFRGHILVHISRRTTHRKQRSRFMIISGFDGQNDFGESHKLTCTTVPPELSDQIEVPLNILKNGYLVYLDRSLGVCTWHIKSSHGILDTKCHFYIPRDWISEQNLGLLSVTDSGSILCPRKGEFMVIFTSLSSDW
ncbi:hypothetical protein TruAng_003216 [Truncatella angustata]|nr:hypothetical protein TruAng_003216 [Truncatella angustata]